MSERLKFIRNIAVATAALGMAASGATVERAGAATPVKGGETPIELASGSPEVISDSMVTLVMRPNPKFVSSGLYGPPEWQAVGTGQKIRVRGNNYVLTDVSFLDKITGSMEPDRTVKTGRGFFESVTSDVVNFTPEVSSRWQLGIEPAEEIDNKPMAIASDVVVRTDGSRLALLRLIPNPNQPEGINIYRKMSPQPLGSSVVEKVVEELIGGFGKYAPWNGLARPIKAFERLPQEPYIEKLTAQTARLLRSGHPVKFYRGTVEVPEVGGITTYSNPMIIPIVKNPKHPNRVASGEYALGYLDIDVAYNPPDDTGNIGGPSRLYLLPVKKGMRFVPNPDREPGAPILDQAQFAGVGGWGLGFPARPNGTPMPPDLVIGRVQRLRYDFRNSQTG